MYSWNILDPKSPLRSKRVQGAFITLVAVFGGLAGFNVTEASAGELLSTGNQVAALVGIFWNQVGGLMSKNSPREF